MRTGTLLLSLLLAVGVSTTADAAKKKRHHHAKPAAAESPILGYSYAGKPYQEVEMKYRDQFWKDVVFPFGAVKMGP